MKDFESELENNFFIRFNELNLEYPTKGKRYKVRLIRPSISERLPFDFSIMVSNATIGIIELKNEKFLKGYDFAQIESYVSENDIRFFIVSDGNQFIITDRNKGFEKRTVLFDEFTKIITQVKEVNLSNLRDSVANEIKRLIMESPFSTLKEEYGNLLAAIREELHYDEINQRFFFSNWDDINNVENRLFRLLLQDKKPIRKIYRYTTLGTIYSSLKNNSYRINCLVGMNDTSEVNYVENYVLGANRDYAQANWIRVDSFNKRFISSCSLKKDDLTQWRLYADDSKGVCMELKVNNNALNGRFILKRISYARKGGRHPELELLKQIRINLFDQFDIIFEFKTLNTWRHFFKPYDYSVEQEVRLLYVHNDEDLLEKDWVLTNSHQILNPYVEFILNDPDFPLKLDKIVLGPKCAEVAINKKQFQAYIRELRRKPEYNLNDVEVTTSSIRNYR